MLMSPSEPEEVPAAAEPLLESMEALVPYTTRGLADRLEMSVDRTRGLLGKLAARGFVQRERLPDERAIWIRHAPSFDCPKCGSQFQVKVLHPITAPVQYCPRCRTRLGA